MPDLDPNMMHFALDRGFQYPSSGIHPRIMTMKKKIPHAAQMAIITWHIRRKVCMSWLERRMYWNRIEILTRETETT